MINIGYDAFISYFYDGSGAHDTHVHSLPSRGYFFFLPPIRHIVDPRRFVFASERERDHIARTVSALGHLRLSVGVKDDEICFAWKVWIL